ncbi:phosphoglycolate phosphatase [Primorskyibacter marinus]|uniref:phosphoglycolate phosphatase n=1 Tax=Primorskyibacter marinus TaxID=1977320 RepID=UPI000E308916|nr:phosphoglycolate phosphatase [Primorskyibacter marinus]
MVATIAFDLDGTLIDSAPDIAHAVNAMLTDEGAEMLTLAEVTGFIGNGLPHLVKLVIEARDMGMARHDALTACVLAHYTKAGSAYTVLYPQVRAALDTLSASGHRLTLCTNKPERAARDVLAHFGLESLFATVIGGDSLTTRKPDPAMLFAALGEDGPQIYVGDSEVDAETARRAGVTFLLYTEGYRKSPAETLPHAARFDDFAQLPGLVTQLLAQGSARQVG